MKIFVGFEPGSPPARVTEAAALAATLKAELVGFVLENLNLLRSAELPIVRELDLLTAKERACSRTSIELSLQTRSVRARRAFEPLARASGVSWSFEVRRCNLLGYRRPHSGRGELEICVLCDEDVPWAPLMAVANQLTQGRPSPIRLVYTTTTGARADELRELEAQLARSGARVGHQVRQPGDALTDALMQCRAVVASARDDQGLSHLLGSTDAPVVLV